MRTRISKELRGRPRGHIPRDCGSLESIVLIASKYDLDPKRLIDAIYEALEKKTSHCGTLTISSRVINQGSVTFLIMEGEKVVWQFPFNLRSIRSPDFRDSITEIPIPEKRNGDELSRNLNIGELRRGMKRVNVTAKVVEIPPAKRVFTRWGTEAFVSNVKMIDETGSIRMALWNRQIEEVQVGDNIEIINCNVASFAEKTQLRLGRKSTLSVIN